MTKIWRETGFVENDPWVIETDEVKATEEQKPLLGLDELITKADESNDVGLGVLIKPADDVRRLEPYLYRLEIVAVAFPAFNDGRAFSHASLLRQRLGYTNELRAVGDVLIDQVPLMLRVGIDSFAVTNPTALKRLSENRLPAIPHHYQPAVRDAEAGKGYSWRRQAKPAA
ncbi:DUF934 domain-containing protein (plasmid) [Rhizobium leguminosarum]|uniref:DUF934 domain-containing protein n=1 Tax=Rhizobium leguminosarum TaxID=384 RepID=A0A4Q8Y139_RHILE|nr:DUF934 domain-containing protein [Rhizobium leguminosarum]TAU91539.1 DUF934 domain-containing protein [Rhizobium leguminosarum]TAV56159.1 DUF934 domain-containing protein [Rhizobium leguminosarum]TAX45823.1 DUF934 domain-containing protein [Rhizobium leguminosarum]TAX55590.1 DUF934 domain-containing protein [Rhizobium leguminosarum]TAX71918.1 DUF934 domain-containing protein [Rhizobium leguminosarum]